VRAFDPMTRTMIDLTADLTAWLATPEVRVLLKSIVTEAVRDELRSALEDELLDVHRAAQMLGMSAGALRKAVERGQVPCERIGTRLRFRRMDPARLGRERPQGCECQYVGARPARWAAGAVTQRGRRAT
jgi:Arc/MetJ family transcription regulator